MGWLGWDLKAHPIPAHAMGQLPPPRVAPIPSNLAFFPGSFPSIKSGLRAWKMDKEPLEEVTIPGDTVATRSYCSFKPLLKIP